ncbi:ribosomal protein S18-alanine N-acetyltransferase [Pokkaliibacter sp. CJK22405]|uniref:ribosomal protein S18-alanine N-acetyltransferase n=1 Tax=Pokkaliibacter sp. CJK22405 TaxID=3384615 RepID=UPI0039855BC6
MSLISVDASSATLLAEQAARAFSHPWTEKQFAGSAESGHWLAIWQSEERMLGHVVISQVLDEAEILTIAVEPAAQGRGIGSAMLKQVIARLREQHMARLMLEVRSGNHAALALYRKWGFVEDGRRKGYYPGEDGGPAEDALLMSLLLTEQPA